MKNYLTILLAMLALLTVFCCAAENTDNTSDNTGSSNSPVGKWFSYENGQAFTLDYYDYRADGTVWLIQPAQPEYVDNWWNNPDVETSEQKWWDWKDNYVIYYHGSATAESQPHFRIEGDIMTWYESHEGETHDMEQFIKLK